MKTIEFPGIEITSSEAETITEPRSSEICGVCSYAQRTGGFNPGLTCLNRNSPNYLKRIREIQDACESIRNKSKT